MPDQDAYSYELAQLHIGGAYVADMEQKFQAAVERLPFEFRGP